MMLAVVKGVLVVVRASAANEVKRRLTEGGFELRHWDNGTSYEDPWRSRATGG
jgi:hypothetical protein